MNPAAKTFPIFDHGQHHYELIEAMGCFRTLIRFAEDKSAIEAHLLGAGRPHGLGEDGEIVAVPDPDVGKFKGAITESVDVALSTYRRQMIVVFVSLTEVAIAEAFRVLFCFAPESIKALAVDASSGDFKSTISVQQVLEAASLADLRLSIVERAVGTACQGKNKRTVMRRIGKLFGRSLASDVEESYLALCELRNEIVHEHHRIELFDSDIERACDSSLKFLQNLGRLVASKSLPVNDPLQICHG